MNEQRTFQKILAEVEQLDAQIRLKLPASRNSVTRQVERIHLAQQQLKAVKVRVLQLAARVHTAALHHNYRSLVQRIEQILRDAVDFQLLAEEYPIDPDGASSCLQSMRRETPCHSPTTLVAASALKIPVTAP
ncbi:MAG: hypothetical protein HC866_23770 [Leptolyngbyaceae cyanobacterium RU_5_1]|nr:hypothetical protein [Leptolyngbyaceae cyanobacterium RU_5_1]